MGIFDGGFNTAVPNLNGAVGLVNANGNLLASARNNLIGNVIGTDDSTLNRWEQGVRNLNTQQLTNQYKALTPEQLRAYEAQGIDPRQAIADRAGFIYNDFDKDLEAARAGAETRLSNYNDTWLQNQYDLLSDEDKYNNYLDDKDIVKRLIGNNLMSHYSRDKADALYKKSIEEGRTVLSKKNADAYAQIAGDPTKTLEYWEGNQELVNDPRLSQRDLESLRKSNKTKAAEGIKEEFATALLNEERAGADITDVNTRKAVLDNILEKHGLNKSGVTVDNFNIVNPNTKEYAEQAKYQDERNKTLFTHKASDAVENSDVLKEEGSKTNVYDINFDKIHDELSTLVRTNYPNVSDEEVERIISNSPKYKSILTHVSRDLENQLRTSDYFKWLSHPDLDVDKRNQAKTAFYTAMNSALDKYKLPNSVREKVQGEILKSVQFAEQRADTFTKTELANKRAEIEREFDRQFSNISDDSSVVAEGFKETMLNGGSYKFDTAGKVHSNLKNINIAKGDFGGALVTKLKDQMRENPEILKQIEKRSTDSNFRNFLLNVFLEYRRNETVNKTSVDDLRSVLQDTKLPINADQLGPIFKIMDWADFAPAKNTGKSK